MATFLQDLRHALRGFARTRGFSAVAVTTLALGIGATTAIFTLAHAVLFDPLGFPAEHQLVRITSDLPAAGLTDAGVAVPELDDYRTRTSVFESVAGLLRVNANLTGAGIETPERIEGLLVTPEYFELLGAVAEVGRLFGPADEAPGIADVAVITHGLWTRLFGADPDAVGRTIRLDGDVLTIIGVLPEDFQHLGRGLGGEPLVFAPAGFTALPFEPPTREFAGLDGAIGRLREGVSIERAREDVARLGASLRAAYPEAYADAGWQPRLVPLRESLVGEVRAPLVVLLAAVGAVLLIACANVAGLLMARNAARQHEFAVRRALGATPGRLGRQLLTESLLLGLVGGAAGLLVASWMTAALATLVPPELPRAADLALDGRVLAFALALSAATGLLFGLLPALTARADRPAFVLRGLSRTATASRRHVRARNALVVAELAVALVLLVAAALLIRSFAELTRVDPGFSPDGVLAASIWLPRPNDPATGPYFTQQQQRSFYRRALDDVRALPGIESAAWASWLPLGGEQRNAPFFIEGRPAEAVALDVEPFLVSEDYFETLAIPLHRGRVFTAGDVADAPNVIVVSESLARRYFPGEEAIGQRLYRDLGPDFQAARYTIVGVVGDVRTGALDRSAPPQLYRSIWQRADSAAVLLARTAGAPSTLEAPIRGAISGIDPDLPLFRVRPMTDVVAGTLATRRFATLIIGAFSALALVLACVGIYGVIAYLVEQRTSEIGVRLALGATPGDILRMVVGGGLTLAAVGVGAGVVGALGVTRLLGGLLYGVSPFDPTAFAVTAAALMLVAALSSAVPARRAARVNPVVALRSE